MSSREAPPPELTGAYEEERAYWRDHAAGHFAEAELPFIRWHHQEVRGSFDLPADQLVMEVGCGAGRLLRGHAQVLAVDFSPAILARVRHASPDYRVVCASVHALPFRSGTIRNVVANNMLHHVKGEGLLDEAIEEIHRVLAPDGRFYVNDRNPTLVHHLVLSLSNLSKRVLRRSFGDFPGCGSFNEPLFTRRDWKRIGRRFREVRQRSYYTVFLWIVDSLAKGLAVVLRRERGFVARAQERFWPLLSWLERHARWRPLCIERACVLAPRRPTDRR